MLETFTPAVCGSRKRQIVAQALFAVSAVVTAAALGLVLGTIGNVLGAERAVLIAAALALLAAAREAGLLRLPLPQARRQVPERWRFELPLPVWASGYGAGLGAGFFTFHPVSTFWIACAGALALASPAAAALCFSLYGAGRALMVVWPRRHAGDPTAAVERLAGKRGALLRANAIALVACGVLLALAPTAGGGVRVAQNAYDPSYSGGVLAFATQAGNVVVRSPGRPQIVYENASQPALDRSFLAYVDGAGVRIVRWLDGTEVGRVPSRTARRPALDWPLVAFVRREEGWRRLVVRNIVTGGHRVHVSVRAGAQLGRPSLRGGRLAWHTVTRSQSSVLWKPLKGSKRVVMRSKVALVSNPSLYRSRILWTEERSGVSYVRLDWLGAGPRRTLERMRTRIRAYWTTTLGPGRGYWTRWALGTGAAAIYRGTY
jgi:cytochrome c biogenesis protein CcdA